MRLTLDVKVDVEDIVDSLGSYDLMNLVKSIDERVAEWDFTLALYEHFSKLKAEYDAEVRDAGGRR